MVMTKGMKTYRHAPGGGIWQADKAKQREILNLICVILNNQKIIMRTLIVKNNRSNADLEKAIKNTMQALKGEK